LRFINLPLHLFFKEVDANSKGIISEKVENEGCHHGHPSFCPENSSALLLIVNPKMKNAESCCELVDDGFGGYQHKAEQPKNRVSWPL